MFTTATNAANTPLNCGDAICDFITLLANNPRPRIKFSRNNSGTTCCTFDAFTLFTKPLMDFFNASQDIR